MPKGSLCNLSVNINVGLPPDAVYNIVTDPDNKRVFKNIKASNNGFLPSLSVFLSPFLCSLSFKNETVFVNLTFCSSVSQEVISRRVLVDEGLRQVVELEQAAIWKFLWWSGTIAVHVLVDQNRKDHSVTIHFPFCCTAIKNLFFVAFPTAPIFL